MFTRYKWAMFIAMSFVLLSDVRVFAVELAPAITDREIIESLVDLRATQKVIMGQLEAINRRFEQVDRRFEQVDRRFEQAAEQVDKRFEQAAEQADNRFDDINYANRLFFGFTLSILLALFGYIIWDRRTLMKPLEEKITNVERELEIGSTDGNKVDRLLKSLRELSKEDEKVAGVLKQFHLL